MRAMCVMQAFSLYLQNTISESLFFFNLIFKSNRNFQTILITHKKYLTYHFLDFYSGHECRIKLCLCLQRNTNQHWSPNLCSR